MRQLSFLIFTCVLFVGCQSRDFKPVTVKDPVVEKSDVSDRQKIEEARALVADGSNEFQKGNMDSALEKAKASIQTFELIDGYSLLGSSYYQLGDYENAKLAFEKGKNIDPKNEKLLIGLGTVQSTLGENEEALSTYQTFKPTQTRRNHLYIQNRYPFKKLRSLPREPCGSQILGNKTRISVSY